MSTAEISINIHKQKIGQLLANARAEKRYTLDYVSQQTKIRVDYLRALESDDYQKFASPVYAKGLLKTYAKFLGLDVEKLMALYRRENAPQPKAKQQLSLRDRYIGLTEGLLSQRGITTVVVVMLLALIGFYVVSQVGSLLNPPALKLIEPTEITANFNDIVFVPGNSFKIQGVTESQTVVRMNGEPLQVEADLSFESSEIPLKDESVTILLTATNQFGRTATIQMTVKRGSPGVAKADKMSILIEVQNEVTPMLVRTDGTIQFNERGFPGDVISLEARERLQIESDTPANIKVTINGELYEFSATGQTWVLDAGEVRVIGP